MKNVFIGLFAFGSISAFAGTLVSAESQEKLGFSLNAQSNILSVTSDSRLVESKEIHLEDVQSEKSQVELFASLNYVTNSSELGVLTYPFAAAYDLAILPVKGVIKTVTNKKLRKEHDLLLDAINTNSEIIVSEEKFERIAKRVAALESVSVDTLAMPRNINKYCKLLQTRGQYGDSCEIIRKENVSVLHLTQQSRKLNVGKDLVEIKLVGKDKLCGVSKATITFNQTGEMTNIDASSTCAVSESYASTATMTTPPGLAKIRINKGNWVLGHVSL